MPIILAIEPDRRQASHLAGAVRQKVLAELILTETTEGALDAIGDRVPDMVLVPALLSPQDDAALAAALHVIAAASHVRMLTIPLLANGTKRSKPGGMLAKFRRGHAESTASHGCDPSVFADQINAYLQEAAAERASLELEMDDDEEVGAVSIDAAPSLEMLAQPIDVATAASTESSEAAPIGALAEQSLEPPAAIEPVEPPAAIEPVGPPPATEPIEELAASLPVEDESAEREVSSDYDADAQPDIDLSDEVDGLAVESEEEPLAVAPVEVHAVDEPAPEPFDLLRAFMESAPFGQDLVPLTASFAESETIVDWALADFFVIDEQAVCPLVADAAAIEQPAVQDLGVAAPAIDEPVVETNVVAAPPIDEPIAETAAVQAPVIEESVARAFAVEAFAIDEPVAATNVVAVPPIDEAIAETTAVQAPVIEESVARAFAVEAFAIDEPVAETNVVAAPPVDEPIAETTAVEAHASEALVVEESIAEEPVVEEPAVEKRFPDQTEPPRSDVEPWAPMYLKPGCIWPTLEGVLAESVISREDIQPHPEDLPIAAVARPDAGQQHARPASTASQPDAPDWVELIASLRQDIERRRGKPALSPVPTPVPTPAMPIAAARPTDAGSRHAPRRAKKQKTFGKRPRPLQDEWGLFDPAQCGFSALLAKLEEITSSADDSDARPS